MMSEENIKGTSSKAIPVKKADSPWERLVNGLVKENPTFVLMLGMCPTLAVTTSAMNGLGMGLATTAVLMMSNLFISILRKVIPSRVRIPAFIVIIATFVTAVQLLMEAYLPALNTALGMYIPLIVVNCIILGRAESYAYGNPPIPAFFDGLGMGLGFSVALTCIGAVRELLGTGNVFDTRVLPASYVPINIFVLAPGAFFVLAMLTALQNFIKLQMKKAGKESKKLQSGCSEDCMSCPDKGCARRFYDDEAKDKKAAKSAEAKDVKGEKEKDVKGRETKEEREKAAKGQETKEEKESATKAQEMNAAKENGTKEQEIIDEEQTENTEVSDAVKKKEEK